MKNIKKKYGIGILAAACVVAVGAFVMLRADSPTVPVLSPAPEVAVPTPAATTTLVVLDDGAYLVVPGESWVKWSTGTQGVAAGSFAVQTGAATVSAGGIAGTFTIDMNSLKVLSLGGGDVGKESVLETELKSEAAFDGARFPIATFAVTEVVPKIIPNNTQTSYVAKGVLTMKGVAKEVSFPLAIETVSSDTARAVARFSIDRTLWGVNFGSAKIVQNATDKIIGDIVDLELMVTMRKQ